MLGLYSRTMSLTAREMSATARSRAHEAKLAKQTRSSQGAKLNAFMEGLLKGGRKRVSPVRHAVDSPVGDRAGGMTRVQDARWEIVSRGGSLSKSGAVLTCADALEEGVYAAVAGPLLNASGLTEFSLAILKSESNTGGAMLLGVVEDTDEGHHHERQGAATERASGWGRAFGLAPWNGRFFGFPHADTRDPSRAGEVRGDALMVGDCRGSAEGTSVRVRVDATQRHLYFFVKGGAQKDAGEWVLARENGEPIVLPKGMRLRPFARCGTKSDMIALSSAEAELTGIGKGAAQGLGLQTIARDLGIELNLTVATDATAAIGIARRGGLGKVRHLATADLWIQDKIRKGDFALV